MPEFSTRIKELRLSRKMDQLSLANILGVTKQTISGWESGKFSPPLPKVAEISQKLNVSLNWLIGNDEDQLQRNNLSVVELDLLKLWDNATAEGQSAAKAVLIAYQKSTAQICPNNHVG